MLLECPEWGSNPHWEDFKSSASAIGLSGRPRSREVQSLLGAQACDSLHQSSPFMPDLRSEFS